MEITKGDNLMADTFTYKQYTEGEEVKRAKELLDNQQKSKPGEYKSQWQSGLDDTMKKILNREKFSYDLNGDALYQQYKDQYVLQGQKAMMDTMGQAQAMTGGYGNSYAQTAGQQTYQGYLQQLNDKIPELYQLALDKYQMEGDDLKDQYSMMYEQEEKDYGRYRDTVSDWENEINRLQDQYNTEREFDYNKYDDDRNFEYGKYVDDREHQYQKDRDAIEDEQWLKEYEETKRQFDEELAENKRQFDEDLAWEKSQYSDSSSGSSSGGSSSGGGGGYNYDTHGLSTEEIKALQRELGVTADGIWGPKTEAAYQAKYGGGDDDSSADDYFNSLISSGYDKSEVGKEINKALNDGAITPEEARKLKNTYTPRGYTY